MVLARGNENPYLRGKPPKKHLEFHPVLQPDPLQGLTGDRRREVARQVGARCKADFDQHLKEVSALLRQYNPFQAIAHLAYYDQIVLEGRPTKGYEPIDQCMVELVQALIMMIPEGQFSLGEAPDPDVLMKLNASLHTLQQGFGMARLGQEHENSPAALAAELMRQQTAFIRNDGFPPQIRRLHAEIFQPIDAAFAQREGITLTEVLDALWKLVDVVSDRITEDLHLRQQILGQKTSEKIIEQLAPTTGQDVASIREGMRDFFHDVQKVRAAVTHHINEGNFRLFFFKTEDFKQLFRTDFPADKINMILDTFSLGWGALKDSNPDHFILSNPVWTKPIIAVGNGMYFFPLVSLVQSFGLQMVEQLLLRHPDLKTKYQQDVRAEFLERRTAEAVRKVFPDAQIYCGLKWTDKEGRVCENDVLVLFDTHALVFECKSGRMRARALRGDVAALKDDLEKLVEDPARQGKQFADYIMGVRGKIKLKDGSNKWNELDLSRLIRATTVNVTVEYLGMLAVQHHLLRESGLVAPDVAPAASIPLHDLECVLDLLDTPTQAFHYLRRRAEIVAANEILSDEMGLLSVYLATGFDFGDAEGNRENTFVFKAMGEALIPYFMGQTVGRPVPKPQRRLTGWWKDILAQFDQKRFPGWVEASYALLSVGFEKQKGFEKNVRTIVREVRHNWHTKHNDAVIMVLGAKTYRTAILASAIKNKTREETRALVRSRMGNVAEEHKAQRVLALAVSATTKIRPYLIASYWCPELDNPGESMGAVPAEEKQTPSQADRPVPPPGPAPPINQ